MEIYHFEGVWDLKFSNFQYWRMCCLRRALGRILSAETLTRLEPRVATHAPAWKICVSDQLLQQQQLLLLLLLLLTLLLLLVLFLMHWCSLAAPGCLVVLCCCCWCYLVVLCCCSWCLLGWSSAALLILLYFHRTCSWLVEPPVGGQTLVFIDKIVCIECIVEAKEWCHVGWCTIDSYIVMGWYVVIWGVISVRCGRLVCSGLVCGHLVSFGV